MEADDDLYVQATTPGTDTTVIGGLGSDTINVTGDVIKVLVPNIVFPVVPHVLTNIAGPLTVIGGAGPDRPLIAAIKRPGELDGPFGPTPPQPPEDLQIDVLNIYDDGRTTNASGTLTSTGLSWTGSAGITFGDPSTGLTEFERLNLLLGAATTCSISGTLVAADGRVTLTVIHGGGGSDAIIVTGGGGPVTQLVLYGDTSQDGSWYAGGTAGIDAGAKPFGGGRFLFPVGVPFSNPGDDFIDAEALFDDAAPGALPTLGIIAYGGAGNDFILGTQAADMLLGGSGDDVILGERGPDRIWGDSGLIVGVIELSRTVVTANTSVNPSADGLVAGTDILFGEGAANLPGDPGDFDDIIFGDHGMIVFCLAPPPYAPPPAPPKRGTHILLARDDSTTTADGDDAPSSTTTSPPPLPPPPPPPTLTVRRHHRRRRDPHRRARQRSARRDLRRPRGRRPPGRRRGPTTSPPARATTS